MATNTKLRDDSVNQTPTVPARNGGADMARYVQAQARMPEVLEIMGFSGLREGQELPIKMIMAGRDVICVLPTGGGKCLHGDTMVMLHTGSTIKAKEIRTGDLLMGWDSTPREVKATCKGHDQLFIVKGAGGIRFIGNKEHVLTVVDAAGNISDISIEDYMRLNPEKKESLKLFRTKVKFPERSAPKNDGYKESQLNSTFIPWEYKVGSFSTRYQYIAGIVDKYFQRASCKKLHLSLSWAPQGLLEDILFLVRSVGFSAQYVTNRSYENDTSETHIVIAGDLTLLSTKKVPRTLLAQNSTCRAGILRYAFTVGTYERDHYYGFELDGDGRYLHSDFMVSHNSAIFTIPALALDCRMIIFSPLTALMRDQVRSLSEKGIASVQINSTMSTFENLEAIRAWESGDVKIMYVAPERLNDAAFMAVMHRKPPEMVVLDEAHTASSWSDTFRPSYVKIGAFIQEFNPRVVAAFTATAPQEVIEDIKRIMGLQNALLHIHYPERKNLHITSSVEAKGQTQHSLLGVLRNIEGSCIVYCATRESTELVCQFLQNNGINANYYHGDVAPDLRRRNQDSFMEGRTDVMVATNAFGMGIDKPDIRGVIHYHIPGSLEAYSQEIGRAGRDQKDSTCHLFVNEEGINTQRFLWQRSNPSSLEITTVFNFLKNAANKDGIIKLTGAEIGKGSRVMGAEAVLQFMKGQGVIEREFPTVKMTKIKLNIDEDAPVMKEDSRLLTLVDVLRTYGAPSSAGYMEIDQNILVSRLAQESNKTFSDSTVMGWIRNWNTKGLIDLIKPFSGKVIRILQTPSEEEMGRLDGKRAENLTKLQDMFNFAENIADEEKGKYLTEYFKKGH